MSHWISAIIGTLLGVLIFYAIRRDRLLVRHGLGWVVAAAALVATGIYPKVIDTIAIYLGVGYPPTLAFVVAFAVIIIKVLVVDIELSNSEVRITRITQHVAMLEATIIDLRGQIEMERSGQDHHKQIEFPESVSQD